ncbi:hypothetical protein [Sphaerisporangium aureirubrum]|uniref:Uncharacterized protein n=1 Tax=Sphaerisporangium aureirubrum TaxID=1544736 RepID=A0ABW1NL96_9ACTN
MTAANIAELDDRTVIRALQEVTEELAATAGLAIATKDSDEAQALLAALLEEGELSDSAPLALAMPCQYAAARRVLVALAENPATGCVTDSVLADPPSDTRLGTELAAPAIVVLAAVVVWLQTKVDIRIKRKDGKTEFEFRVAKEAASAGLLKDIVKTIVQFWTGPPQP